MAGYARIPPGALWRPARLLCRLLQRPAQLVRHRRPSPPLVPQRLKQILIQAPNWLGDCVMALPLLEHVRAVCPAVSIRIASRPSCAALWELVPGVEEVIRFDRFSESLSLVEMIRFVRLLRDRAFDASIVLAGGFEFALLHAWAGIAIRIGYESDHRRLLLTHPLSVSDTSRTRHLTQSYLDLGPSSARPQSGDHACWSSNAPLRPINCASCSIHGPLYGPAKRWPAHRFAELGTRIAEGYGAEIILVGTADGRATAAEINRLMHDRAVDLTGQTSLKDLCALMRESALVVSCDSGPAHLADALEVPLVVLFGLSSPTWTGPGGRQSQTIYHASTAAHASRAPAGSAHTPASKASARMRYSSTSSASWVCTISARRNGASTLCMKIALVLDRFDRDLGGLERATSQLACSLVAHGHEVHVVATAFAKPSLAPGITPHPIEASPSRLERAAAGRTMSALA